MSKFLFHSHKILEERRKELRKNQTPEEEILWKNLRYQKLGCKFQRQHSIGRFIVDFYCAKYKLVIELDGGQHKNNKEYDKERTGYIKELGFIELRFWNKEIKANLKQVLQKIVNAIQASS